MATTLTVRALRAQVTCMPECRAHRQTDPHPLPLGPEQVAGRWAATQEVDAELIADLVIEDLAADVWSRLR